MRLRNVGLAALWGRDKAEITRWQKQGMPVDSVGGVKTSDPETALAWLQAEKPEVADKVRAFMGGAESQAVAAAAAQGTEPAPKRARELDPDEEALVAVLRNPRSTPVALAEAGVGLAARRIARDYEAGRIGARALEDLKKQGEELRRSKADYLDLAEREGELITRDQVRVILSSAGSVLNATFDRLAAQLPVQVEQWRADVAYAGLDTEGRARAVRDWAENIARRLRHKLADEIDKHCGKGGDDVPVCGHGNDRPAAVE